MNGKHLFVFESSVPLNGNLQLDEQQALIEMTSLVKELHRGHWTSSRVATPSTYSPQATFDDMNSYAA